MSERRARVVLADDQRDVLASLRLLLKSDGIDAIAVSSPAGLLDAVHAETFDAALIDLNYARDTTSGQEGLDLVTQIQAIDPLLPVIVVTAWATVDIAVEAIRRGARDFIEKPWDNRRLLTVVRNQVSYSRAMRRSRCLEAENALLQPAPSHDLVASSAAMREVLDVVHRIAPSDASVLLTGENGTGKNVIARLIHKLSKRAAGPFIAVDLGSIPDSVFEGEMFGHTRGAFTDAKSERIGRFELAHGGTLFLDELGNVPLSQQPKLLRAIESGEFERLGSSRTQRVDVRLICATNADVRAMVAQGSFRQDLLFRLNTVEILVPPLRERSEDILPIAMQCLTALAAKYERQIEGLDPSAHSALCRYSWPGNVRELRHVLERAVLMARGRTLSAADLRLERHIEEAPNIESMSLEDAERVLVREALRRAGGNVNAAAEMLGLSRSAMYRRLEKAGIRLDDS